MVDRKQVNVNRTPLAPPTFLGEISPTCEVLDRAGLVDWTGTLTDYMCLCIYDLFGSFASAVCYPGT